MHTALEKTILVLFGDLTNAFWVPYIYPSTWLCTCKGLIEWIVQYFNYQDAVVCDYWQQCHDCSHRNKSYLLECTNLKRCYEIWRDEKMYWSFSFHRLTVKYPWLSPYFKPSVYSYWLLCVKLKYSEFSIQYYCHKRISLDYCFCGHSFISFLFKIPPS